MNKNRIFKSKAPVFGVLKLIWPPSLSCLHFQPPSTGAVCFASKSQVLQGLAAFSEKTLEHSNLHQNRMHGHPSHLSVGQDPYVQPTCKAAKKSAIAGHFLITNIGLPASLARFNLQLLEYLKHQPGNQSRSTWEQSLAPIALETNFSSLRSPTA
jgi:hypothetical protein